MGEVYGFSKVLKNVNDGSTFSFAVNSCTVGCRNKICHIMLLRLQSMKHTHTQFELTSTLASWNCASIIGKYMQYIYNYNYSLNTYAYSVLQSQGLVKPINQLVQCNEAK